MCIYIYLNLLLLLQHALIYTRYIRVAIEAFVFTPLYLSLPFRVVAVVRDSRQLLHVRAEAAASAAAAGTPAAAVSASRRVIVPHEPATALWHCPESCKSAWTSIQSP